MRPYLPLHGLHRPIGLRRVMMKWQGSSKFAGRAYLKHLFCRPGRPHLPRAQSSAALLIKIAGKSRPDWAEQRVSSCNAEARRGTSAPVSCIDSLCWQLPPQCRSWLSSCHFLLYPSTRLLSQNFAHTAFPHAIRMSSPLFSIKCRCPDHVVNPSKWRRYTLRDIFNHSLI